MSTILTEGRALSQLKSDQPGSEVPSQPPITGRLDHGYERASRESPGPLPLGATQYSSRQRGRHGAPDPPSGSPRRTLAALPESHRATTSRLPADRARGER